MPIAASIPSFWPPTLFDGQQSGGDSRTWSAFQVRPRAEKVVSQRLKQSRIAYFLPLHEEVRKYQRRSVTVQNVLFPGYVFAFGESEEILQNRFTLRGVINHLEDPRQERLRGSLHALRKLIETGAPVTREERLEPGMAVEITSGPLAGYRGQVIENKQGLRFVVQLDFIQQGASVAVDGAVVRAL